MKTYELIAVMDAKATAAKKKSFQEKLEKQVAAFGGKILETVDWGQKTLAYPIAKNTTGVFLIISLELDGKGAKDMLARLRLEDSLIRYLFITKEENIHMKSHVRKSIESTEAKEATETNDKES